MSDKMIKEEDLLKSVQDTVGEINDILAKSQHLGMPEEEDDLQDASAEGGEYDEGAEMSDEGMEGDPETEAAGDEEMAPEGDEMSEEGDMEGDPEAEMREHLASLSDEELDEYISMLMEEKDSRSQTTEEGAPEGDMDMDKSSDKEDYLKLQKSMEALTEKLDAQNKEIAELKKGRRRVSARAAATRRTQDALNKSAEAKPERLNKSDSVEFLYGQIKQRNPLVTSQTVLRFNSIAEGDTETLHKAQDELIKQGLQFPKL